MKMASARKGSALLIVLGMIGVMVVSAVAFSAYMRYSRLPSSYLRRTSSARHLAHAALAEAIDVIDASIGHNPHPGFGNIATEYPRDNGRVAQRNYWRDHCYIGTNELVEADKTVSVLTLEALAYIPPALVNDARYYSRHTPAATWRQLGYDAGRYAFFAIDVSDCLDVNRVPADYGRNSSDGGKFSLAWAFENNNHTSYGAVKPAAWDSFLENFVDIDALRDPTKAPSTSKMPFTSLADLGLALYNKVGTIAQQICPAVSYLAGGTSFDDIETSSSAGVLKRFNVIADGYYPSCATKANQPGNLADPRRQPFPSMKKGNAKTTNREVLTLVDGGTSTLLEDNMTELDIISLYDYLDDNDLPVSLALPTVERVPMICGLQSTVQLTLTPKATVTQNPSPSTITQTGQFYEETTSCSLEVQGVGGFSALYMFPFLRDKDVPTSGYTAETALRICFGVSTPGLRTTSSSAYVIQTASDFTKDGVVNGAMQPKVQTQSLSFSSVKKPEDAVVKRDSPINFGSVNSWLQAHPLFSVKKKMVATKDPVTGNITFTEDASARTAVVDPDFHPVNADGTGDGGFNQALLIKDGSVTVTPYMTIVSRITKGSDTVDMVPASFEDDNKYNAVNNDKNIGNLNGGAAQQPIMTFCGDKSINFDLATFTAGSAVNVTIQPTGSQSVFCPDPRWNFAPENFVRVNQALDPNWYTASSNPQCGIGDNGRDGDIFMFVSNQGYMQSISELAFLPRTSIDLGGGSKIFGDAQFSFDYTDFPTAVTDAKNWNLMWRTYRLYPQGGLSADPLYDIGLFDGGRGTRLNPYTSSREAMLSALANPPYSWWAASTNNQVKSLEELDAETFNKTYAFNGMNNNAKFAWEDLEKVADNICAAMRANGDGDWTQGYTALDWAGMNSDFVGVNFTSSDDLYDVDRKFLYGYWRDCFAAKQQLFLVFVRAEPMMMGSGAVGQTPPQLGARAMALVWRNPAAGNVPGIVGGNKAWPDSLENTRKNVDPSGKDGGADANRPHKTRVLFYRQFE